MADWLKQKKKKKKEEHNVLLSATADTEAYEPGTTSTTASTMVASDHTTEHRHTERGLELKRSQPSRRSNVKKRECGYFKWGLKVKDVS